MLCDIVVYFSGDVPFVALGVGDEEDICLASLSSNGDGAKPAKVLLDLALLIAAYTDDGYLARLLLRQGADVNFQNCVYGTALGVREQGGCGHSTPGTSPAENTLDLSTFLACAYCCL